MATATLIMEGFYREYGLQADRGTEYYLVEDAVQFELDDFSTIVGLPQPGSTIGDNIPVQRTVLHNLLSQTAPFSFIAAVYAYSIPSGTIVPYGRNARLVRSSPERLSIPIIETVTVTYTDNEGGSGSTTNWIHKQPIVIPRMTFRLVYTTVANVAFSTVDTFNGNNIGKRYVLSGSATPYLFEGCEAVLLQNNQLRITGQWFTTMPHPAISSGTYPGQSISIPALGNLDEYIVQLNPGSAPVVSVLPISRIPAGATYPF